MRFRYINWVVILQVSCIIRLALYITEKNFLLLIIASNCHVKKNTYETKTGITGHVYF